MHASITHGNLIIWQFGIFLSWDLSEIFSVLYIPFLVSSASCCHIFLFIIDMYLIIHSNTFWLHVYFYLFIIDVFSVLFKRAFIFYVYCERLNMLYYKHSVDLHAYNSAYLVFLLRKRGRIFDLNFLPEGVIFPRVLCWGTLGKLECSFRIRSNISLFITASGSYCYVLVILSLFFMSV